MQTKNQYISQNGQIFPKLGTKILNSCQSNCVKKQWTVYIPIRACVNNDVTQYIRAGSVCVCERALKVTV